MSDNQPYKNIKMFSSTADLAEGFAADFVKMINESVMENRKMTIALSGGSTPELLFSLLGGEYSDLCKWEYVHFFWGDERCVPTDSAESNYGKVKNLLFDRIEIPQENIHRIIGEHEPSVEAKRYSDEIQNIIRSRDGMPLFDLVILGMGDDGHTASLFPGQRELFSSERICEVAVHPLTQQKRITITGSVINNADKIVFLVTGKKKAEILDIVINRRAGSENLPAAWVDPVYGDLHWFLDMDAGSHLPY